MSSSSADAGVAFDDTEPTMPTAGGGDLTPPPGVSKQAETEMVAPSTSTVFVAGGSGFVGSEICKQASDTDVHDIGGGGGGWRVLTRWGRGGGVMCS